MTLGQLQVVQGHDGLVRVPDHQDPTASELSDVILPPLQAIRGDGIVVSLLEEGGAITVGPSLAVVTSLHDKAVIEDGAGEDPAGGLHQVPGPGVAGPGEGDQGPGGETSSHHEPGPVLRTLGI